MKSIRVRDGVVPLTQLKAKTAEVVRRVQDTGRPVLVTRHGRSVAVLLSVGAFEEYQETMENAALQRAVDAAERQIARGEHVEQDQAEAMMDRLLDRG